MIGRWTTLDPSADEADQESGSPYSYVFNNPVKNTDPDGRIPNIDPPSAKTVIRGAAITTGGVAGGIFAASLATGGIVAAGGTATIVGAPVGWAVGAGIIVGGAATAGVMWLADKISESVVNSNGASSEKTKGPPNPDGAKGKPDHQGKVKELAEKARAENPGKDVVQEKKIKVDGSNRRPDVQVVDPETGKTTKVYEAERRPNSKRNVEREKEYDRLKNS